MSDRQHTETLRAEFERAAPSFVERTRGRFDDMDVVAFARMKKGESVLEVGAGTGNFLALFSNVAGESFAIDLSPAMLTEARRQGLELHLVLADGAHLPLASRSIDLVTSAQTLHHIWEPVPVLREMRRVMVDNGRMLLVDQVATERFEEVQAMNALDRLRDPSHATCRPTSAFRVLVEKTGMRLIDERAVTSEQLLSRWMWPGEFPPERMEAVRAFIAEHGRETGMDFRPLGDDYVFTRRRIMLLAERA